MNAQIQSALVGAVSGAAFGMVYFVKKQPAAGGVAGVGFDPRKLLQPCLVGAGAGLLFGWQGQGMAGVEDVLSKAGTAGIMTAVVQLLTRQGGPLVSGLVGNLTGSIGGILKNLGK